MAEPGRCGSCKHWTKHEGYQDPVVVQTMVPNSLFSEDREGWNRAVDAAEKEQTRIALLYRVCKGIEENAERDATSQDPLPLAVSKDGSNYMALVLTQAEFGCVLWAERDHA